MQVTEVESAGLKRAFKVVVPAAEVAADRDRRLAAIAKDLRLPGFRPGKVPMGMVKARYAQAVMGEVLEERVGNATRQVVTDRGLRPALQPKVELINFADGADLEFSLGLELLPEIALPDFAGLALERLKAVPSEEDLDKAVETIAKRGRAMEDLPEDHAAGEGDVVVADFAGSVEGTGEDGAETWTPFPGGTGSDMPIEIGGGGFIPGFAEGVTGIKAGETRTVEVTFPADYGATELAGKRARFEIAAKKLQKPAETPVDDEVAKRIGFPDLAALREAIRSQIQREYDGLARMKLKRGLLDQLAARADFPVPEGMVEGEFGQIWQRLEADRKEGRLDAEDSGKDDETLKAEYRAIAERRIRLGLLLSEIGRANNITVTQEELARAMRQEAQRYPGQEGAVMDFFRKNPEAAENLRGPIFEEKVIDFVVELAQVTEREVSAEALRAEAAA